MADLAPSDRPAPVPPGACAACGIVPCAQCSACGCNPCFSLGGAVPGLSPIPPTVAGSAEAGTEPVPDRHLVAAIRRTLSLDELTDPEGRRAHAAALRAVAVELESPDGASR